MAERRVPVANRIARDSGNKRELPTSARMHAFPIDGIRFVPAHRQHLSALPLRPAVQSPPDDVARWTRHERLK